MPLLYKFYSALVGYLGLSVEATLPLPQILSNERTKSCKGFRLSVLASWLAGDAMKMFWFFNATTEIPLAFKLCGIFQACCDLYLGWQYLIYGVGETKARDRGLQLGALGSLSRPRTPGVLVSPLREKDTRLE
jgi:solute carrier family 66, member 2